MGGYLLGFALEPLLGLVRPPPRESRLPRVDHLWVEGMYSCEVVYFRLHGRGDGPAAAGRVFQVFDQRIIVLLPAVEILMAEEAGDVVGAAGLRLVHETGSCEL